MKWISVKESLPEDFVEVLTCDCRGNIHIMFHHHKYEKPFGVDRHNPRYYMVRYWQYLPAPPKGCGKHREAAEYEQIQIDESLL